MDSKVQAYLADILSSIDRIESFFDGVPMRFEDYQSDWKLRLAVERAIEIIGEAMNRILKLEPDIPITHAKAIVGTHLSKLKEEVRALLDSTEVS